MKHKFKKPRLDKFKLLGHTPYQKIKNIFILNPIKRIIFVYFIVACIGIILLSLKASWNSPATSHLTFSKILFFAISAITDTGLSSTESLSHTFNVFGEIVILGLIMFGGVGWMTIKVTLFFIIRKKLSIADYDLLKEEKSPIKIGSSAKLIYTTVIVLLSCEIFFSLIIALNLRFSNSFEVGGIVKNAVKTNFGYAYWVAMFTSVSAINNAGFDIFGSNSLEPFYHDYFFLTMFMILIIIGGIGFPIFLELYEKIKANKNKQIYLFSIYTKICLSFYFGILLFSFLLIILIESLAPSSYLMHVDHDWLNDNVSRLNQKTNQTVSPIMKDKNFTTAQKIFFILFTVVSSRNAGFSTISPQRFLNSSKFILILNMWIGASPCSTGGGIRVTTFAILVLSILSYWKQTSNISIFKRTISRSIVVKAIAVTFLSLILVLITSFIVTMNIVDIDAKNPNNLGYKFSFLDALFESSSAFGTTGLSTGLSKDIQLNWVSRAFLMILMVVGQLTISGTILFGRSSLKPVSKVQYAEESLAIG